MLDSKLHAASVHHLLIPVPVEKLIDSKTEEIIQNMISVIELGRELRLKKGIKVKLPVALMQIINYNKSFLANIKVVEEYVKSELNLLDIEHIEDEEKYLNLTGKANFEFVFKEMKETQFRIKELEEEKKLITNTKEEIDNIDNQLDLEKEKLNKQTLEANPYKNVLTKLKKEEIIKIIDTKSIDMNGLNITLDHLIINKSFHKQFESDKQFYCLSNAECGIRMDTTVDDNLLDLYFTREVYIS